MVQSPLPSSALISRYGGKASSDHISSMFSENWSILLNLKLAQPAEQSQAANVPAKPRRLGAFSTCCTAKPLRQAATLIIILAIITALSFASWLPHLASHPHFLGHHKRLTSPASGHEWNFSVLLDGAPAVSATLSEKLEPVHLRKDKEGFSHVFGYLQDMLANAAHSWGFSVVVNQKAGNAQLCSAHIWYTDMRTKFWWFKSQFNKCGKLKGKPAVVYVNFENPHRKRYAHMNPHTPKSEASQVFGLAAQWLDHAGASPDLPFATDQDKHLALPHWLIFHAYHRNASILQGRLLPRVPVSKRQHADKAVIFSRHAGDDPPNLRADIMDEFAAHNVTVHSYGSFRNNMPDPGPSHQDKMRLMEQYGFNICPENSRGPNYVTEKVLDALLAGTVPIWSGSNGLAAPLIVRESAYVVWNTSRHAASPHTQEINQAKRALANWALTPPAPIFKPGADWWAQTYSLRIVLGLLSSLRTRSKAGTIARMAITSRESAVSSVASFHYILGSQPEPMSASLWPSARPTPLGGSP